MGGFSWLGKHRVVGLFQGGRVVAKEHQRDNSWRRIEGLTLVTFCQVE